jgi:hypothetical protein
MKYILEIQKIYLQAQKPLAYIFLFIGVLGSVVSGWLPLQLSAILAMVFIVLQVLFEIHSELVNHQKISSIVYDNYNKASPEMERVIEEQIRKEKKVSLKWLGTCMELETILIPYIQKMAIMNLKSKFLSTKTGLHFVRGQIR